ncbi:APC family permease [Rhodococcus sp. NPDC056960]|uniref:APC family permease n=1 Tax=Rhodococcus sp. NPDC056960 TaxID=3345982 RepID=UPI00363F6AF9
MTRSSTDEIDYLAEFGYKQELDRSLGKFSSFAAGFSFLSILTGVFMLFGFGFGFGGPAFWWSIPIVVAGQLLVAFLFAELASQYPIAGGIYQWTKQIASPFAAWTAGWVMILSSMVAVTGPAVGLQVVLPQIWSGFQVFGTAADIGTYSTVDGARNAVLLGSILLIAATVINILGVRLMALINNIGVFTELVGCTVLILVLFAKAQRGPDIVTHTDGAYSTSWGIFGAMLIASLFAVNIYCGFDAAGALAEETSNPRRFAPREIIRALVVSAILGAALVLAAQMAMPDILGQNNLDMIAAQGLPYVLKAVLGETFAKLFLVAVAISMCVCALAVQAAGIRMVFSMARDGKLPFSNRLASVNSKTRSMVGASILLGVAPVALLLVNVGNQQVFTTVASIALVLFYIAYLIVTVSLLIRRFKKQWPKPDHGPYFNLGSLATTINIAAVVFQIVALINLMWPRVEIYGDAGWYFQWGAFVFVGAALSIGWAIYFYLHRDGKDVPVAEHTATVDAAGHAQAAPEAVDDRVFEAPDRAGSPSA